MNGAERDFVKMAESNKRRARRHRALFEMAIGLVVGFAAGWVPASAGKFAHNGVFWTRMEAAARQEYVDGYFDAMRLSKARLKTLALSGQALHWAGAPRIITKLSDQLLKDDLPSEQAVEYLNSLYTRQACGEIELGHALELLMVINHEDRLAAGPKADPSIQAPEPHK